jgi:hypothetical protein
VAITEQDLLTAMATTGRSVSSRTIKEWRQCGLLPDLASQSRGLRKGRICFWPDDTIFDRAALIYDLLQDQISKGEIYCLLWLCGMSVPLPQLRRAWSQNAKDSEPWKINGVAAPSARADTLVHPVATALDVDTDASHQASSRLLLQSALTACASLSENAAPEIDALIAAFDGLLGKSPRAKRRNSDDAAPARAIVILLKSVWSAIKSSDLIYASTDADLREAQRHAATALRALHRSIRSNVDVYRSRNGTPAWPIAEARAFGTPLFIFVLLMVKSGQRELLDMALAELRNIVGGETDSNGVGVSAQQPMTVSRPLALT